MVSTGDICKDNIHWRNMYLGMTAGSVRCPPPPSPTPDADTRQPDLQGTGPVDLVQFSVHAPTSFPVRYEIYTQTGF
ncbi:hypothetical protein J6590_019115 [Homalodisca vitripennis]|nr:hypothetical protein J6590_019115 [Homalodisca vitripennis]